MTSKNDNDNGKKRMAIVASAEDGLETLTEHKKKKIENTEVELPTTMVAPKETVDPREKLVKAWNDIRCHNTTGKYYEPVQRQLDLVMEDGVHDKMAYNIAGTHVDSCNSCRFHDDKKVVMMDCYYSDIIQRMTQTGTTMQKGGKYTNVQIRCRLYKEFAEENYAYLRKLRNKSKLPCIPLPWCFEQAIKRSFPNEDNQPFVGFKSSQERGKI